MTTPAKRHKMRVLAELAALAAGPGDEVRGSAYELMLAQLAEHKRTLKTIQSTERKIEAKRKMLPDFEDYVTGALEGGQGAHDMVLTTVLVWHLDAGNWARGLEIAAYALAHGLVLPDQYNRTLPTLLIDETATAAARASWWATRRCACWPKWTSSPPSTTHQTKPAPSSTRPSATP